VAAFPAVGLAAVAAVRSKTRVSAYCDAHS
jgi:hypothetical protein